MKQVIFILRHGELKKEKGRICTNSLGQIGMIGFKEIVEIISLTHALLFLRSLGTK